MLLESLEKFNVKQKIYIEELEHQPSSFLYRSLISLVKEAYTDSERFVFLNFKTVDNDTLHHVAQTLQRLDISPWFVLILTNQQSTIDFFSSLPEPITVIFTNGTSDKQYIESIATPLFNTNQHMCAHAWAGVHFTPAGQAKLCCDYSDIITDDHGNPYNIRTHSIEEIVNNKYMFTIRDQFRKQITPSGCSVCEFREKNGVASKRSNASFKLENIYGLIDWENNVSVPRWIGGHLGNLCNLKCRICNEFFSSSIAIEKLKKLPLEQKKAGKVYQRLLDNNWKNKDDNFWSSLRQLAPQVCNFEFLGGEPLMYDANLDFLKYLLDNDYANQCIFEFVTNGTKYDPLLDSIGQFKRFTITLSIDNINDRFEFERYGASWIEVDQNISRFVDLSKKHKQVNTGVNVTVNIQNIFYLPELVEYLKNKQVSHCYFNLLSSPSWLSIGNLTPTARDQAKQIISDFINNQNDQSLGFLLPILDNVKTSDGAEFCKNMQDLDQTRLQNFAETHKTIALAMGYVL